MLFSTVAIVGLASIVSAQSTVAPVTMNNPSSVMYMATIHSMHVNYAQLNFTGTMNGTGVMVSAAFQGISNPEDGPYLYHIHAKPIDTMGNCTTAGAHLDPYMRGEAPPCDPTMPQTCQVGDLSGKHGKVTLNGETPYMTTYVDPYLSLVSSDPAYIGGLSVVVHFANKTRIGCANITMMSSSTYVPTPPAGNYTNPPVPVPTNGANKATFGGLLLGLTMAAGAMLL